MTEFCVYVLRDLAAASAARPDAHGLTATEIAALRRRLEALGSLE